MSFGDSRAAGRPRRSVLSLASQRAMSDVVTEKVSAVPRVLSYASGFSLFVTLIITPGFMCTCGYLSSAALPVTAFIAILAWVPFVRNAGRSGLGRRVFVLVVAVVATLALAKNVADVLWLGHHPVLRHRGANPASAVDGGITSIVLKTWGHVSTFNN
jgi:hypothetical protein